MKRTDRMTNQTEELKFEPAKFRSDVTVKLMDSMGDQQSIVRRARVSVKGSNSQENVPGTPMEKRDVGLLKRLYKDEHGVPFEGPEFEFYIEAPLFTIQQLLKHRLSSINQSSGRYSEMVGTFYIPSEDRPLVQVGKTMDYVFDKGEEWQYKALIRTRKNACETWWHNYNSLLHIGIAKEVARQDSPHNIYASLYYKCNLRSLLNFLKLRTLRDDAVKIKDKDLIKELSEKMEKVFYESVDHMIDYDKEIVLERLNDNMNFLLGGQRVVSHPQFEISQIADVMSELIQEKFPDVWESYVRAGYYNV